MNCSENGEPVPVLNPYGIRRRHRSSENSSKYQEEQKRENERKEHTSFVPHPVLD